MESDSVDTSTRQVETINYSIIISFSFFRNYRPLSMGDTLEASLRNRCFRFLSKFKSFLLLAPNADLRDAWFEEIEKASM
jgi:hypothetical protein